MDASPVPQNGSLPLDGNGIAEADMTVPQNLPSGISADEIALYDRQIRLWGVQAQERLRTANILLIGMKALGNEITKNLVLAGVGSLTIVDDDPVTEDDLGAQFFITEESIGQLRSQAALPQVQRLNPRVSLHLANLTALLAEPSFFGAYSLVVATDLPLSVLTTINIACRLQGKPFYASSSFGLYGFIFADLIQHTFVISREKSNIETKLGPQSPTQTIVNVTTSRGSDGKTTEQVTKVETYTPINLANTSPLPDFHLSNRRRKFLVSPILSCIRALWDYQAMSGNIVPTHSRQDIAVFTSLANDKHKELQLPTETLRADVLRSFLQNLGSEISPVCAFLGGQLAQDVINVIGGKEQPIQNFLVFDGEETKGPVYSLHTDMAQALESASANGNGVSDAFVPTIEDPSGVIPDINGLAPTAAGIAEGNGVGHARTNSNGAINMSMPV